MNNIKKSMGAVNLQYITIIASALIFCVFLVFTYLKHNKDIDSIKGRLSQLNKNMLVCNDTLCYIDKKLRVKNDLLITQTNK